MKTGLVIVDIQKDYFPKGRMEVVEAVEASQAAKKLLNYFRDNELPVVLYTSNIFPRGRELLFSCQIRKG